ncbi:amidohydrolase family protein [bacterium 210820-DFI.6.37]|nr:amidohydrolase family protein [bacterium 210820-DFI.6.37]
MEKANLLIKSRNIFTGTDDIPFEGFIAVHGNRIIKTGNLQQVHPYLSEKTKVLDYEDQLVMPGFIDAHMHYFCGVFQSSKYMCRELFQAKSEQECVEMIRAFGEKNPQLDKLSGMGWFPPLWDDKTAMPSRRSLDEIEPERPVYLLSADGHTFWLNTKALKACGITKETEVSFGAIGKDENGELTGLLYEIEAEETANSLAFQLPENHAEEMILDFNNKLLAKGITATTDMSVNPEPVGDFSEYALAKKMEERGELDVRLNLYPSMGLIPDTNKVEKLREEYDTDKLRVAGLKQFIDGVSSAYSAYLLEPYSDKPYFTSSPCYPYEIYRDCITHANSKGFGVRLHAIGDGAIRLGLDAIQYAREHSGNTLVRNCLEHLEAIDPMDLPRFRELDVTCSMQPLHMPPTAYEKLIRLGEKRCRYQWPFRSLLDQNAALAFGTDFPVAPYDPLQSVHDAVTRRDEKGEEIKINPCEKISLAEALRAYTAGSAYSIGMDHKLGTLEEGKLADLIVLDKNLFDLEPAEIPNANVILTISDGKIVYQKEKDKAAK